MFRQKKAAIGATMTWVVATIIILFAVILFVTASYGIAKERGVLDFSGKEISNINAEQSLLALLQTEINGMEVRGYVSQGRYPEIKKDVDFILDNLELDDLRAEVYVGNRKVVLDDGNLEVENE